MSDSAQCQGTKLIVKVNVDRMTCLISCITKRLKANFIIHPQWQLLLMAYNSTYGHRSGIASHYVTEYL